MKINSTKTYALLILAAYYYASILLKNDYVSPDAEYFLTASYLEVVDIRYAAWILIINTIGSDNVAALYAAGIILLSHKISKIINNYLYLLIVILLPTVFYFSTIVLRDLMFFLSAQILIIYLISDEKGFSLKFFTLFALIASLVLRPPYGFILIIIFLMYYLSEIVILRVIYFTIAIYLLFGIALMISAEAYGAYVEFIKGGHGKNLNTFGVLEIADAQLSEISALRNYFISFIYFWYVQADGTGALLDVLGFYESLFYVICSAVILYTLVAKHSGRFSKQIKLFTLMLVFSIIMSSFTQSHDDSMRFRLIFVPFMVLLFVLSIETLSKVSVQFRHGILKIIKLRV